MGDDGNRQVAVTLDQIAVSLGLNPEQLEALLIQLSGINGAVNKLAENVAEPDTSVAAEIASLKDEVTRLKHETVVAFSDLIQSIANLNNVIMDRSIDLAKWLAAIALAASTPDDNSAQVQAQIDKHAAEIKTARESLQSSIDRNQP